MKDVHILNLGAGVQSTTLYLMAAYGELPVSINAAIFADTGEEPSAVYRHLDWLDTIGGPPIMRRSCGRLGDDLIQVSNSTGQRFASIPAFTLRPAERLDELTAEERMQLEFLEDTGTKASSLEERVGQTQRQCSREYKVDVIERTIRRELLGLSPGQRVPTKVFSVHQYVGISLDEAGRFTRLQKRRTLGNMHAPLIDRHMTRTDCLAWLRDRGRVPHEVPRSACVFCPFHTDEEWARVKAVPEDWLRAIEVDEGLRRPGAIVNRGMDADMFVHRSCQPLVQVDLRPKEQVSQPTFEFWRDDAFSRECLGVCGL